MVRAGIEKLKNLADQEHCSTKLALSFCVGVYIAFSPFIGLHTVMTFIFVWLFGLNLAATFTASWLINNPWTMIPIYSTDYFFGDWLLHKMLGLDTVTCNPLWMSWINSPLRTYCGLGNISLLAFIIGGNLLGIGISLMLYPVMKRVFDRYARRRMRSLS